MSAHCCPSPITITVHIRMNAAQCHASHTVYYVQYMCTEPMVVHSYMSGLYIYSSTAVVVGCAVLLYGYGIWCLPKVSVWAGANGHLLPLQYTT